MGAGSIPAALLPIQLPACGLGMQPRTAHTFDTFHPHGRPGRRCWLLGSEWFSTSVSATWGVNHAMEDLAVSPPLCISAFPIKLSNSWARHGGTVVKVLALHARDPLWVPVLSLQPRFPSSSLPVARESSQGWPKSLETLHPCGRPGRGSWLRIGIVSARCAHLGSESSDGRSSFLSSLYIRLSNKKIIIKINL